MPTREVTLRIRGMLCQGCAASVEQVLNQNVPGVINAQIHLENGTASVKFYPEKTGPEALITAVEEAGYKAGLDL